MSKTKPYPEHQIHQKTHLKILPKYRSRTHSIKIRYLSLVLLLGSLVFIPSIQQTHATSCPDLRVIFARGSGGERWHDQNYLAFKESLEDKLETTNLNYEFIDLDYPAVGIDKIEVLAGAYFGAGEAYKFGESVEQGVDAIKAAVKDKSCPHTKYVIGGYSQGAMVVSKALHVIPSEPIIYAATFGDPKIYLPEGGGPNPPACQGQNLSDYRIYVPDCRAYKGLLGAYTPYEPADFIGKVGTWCNKRDMFCSSYLVPFDHISYVSDHLYEDASKLIFSKIATAFNFKNEYTSPHDTAILIDSTGSMSSLIGRYKAEALNLAEQTLASGGRVALYDYRDLIEDYTPVEGCNFETCNLETFQAGLDAIEADGGDDTPESLLSASIHVMQHLNWQLGSTKSLVILTDAGYHSPDLDGTTFYDVKKLSQQIDPINFYIITTDENLATYQSLAEATDGSVVSSANELNLLTNTIMARYDSLPRVEEEYQDEVYDAALPQLAITHIVDDGAQATVNFNTDGTNTVVILNDAVLGATNQSSITLTGLDRSIDNTISLAPLSTTRRGETDSVVLAAASTSDPDPTNLTDILVQTNSNSADSPSSEFVDTPNTGAPDYKSSLARSLVSIAAIFAILSISVALYLHHHSRGGKNAS